MEKLEPNKNFNTQWGTVYSKDLAEFTKEEIMALCTRDVVDIHVPSKDDDNRLMGPPIIKLEFEKDTMIHILL